MTKPPRVPDPSPTLPVGASASPPPTPGQPLLADASTGQVGPPALCAVGEAAELFRGAVRYMATRDAPLRLRVAVAVRGGLLIKVDAMPDARSRRDLVHLRAALAYLKHASDAHLAWIEWQR